ncbi:MAG: DUF692 family protein [Anaerolineae bacterium]|nr:DUF692 family protein [Anaerolineae bacterium]
MARCGAWDAAIAMQFAVNYSEAAAALLHAGKVQFNRFKCPAWPDLVARVQAQYPVYIHCPLRVGMGTGDALDTETGSSADWDKYEALLMQTGTPWVSLHLGPQPGDHPEIPVASLSPEHVERVTEALIRDVNAVVARFGPEHVVGENIFSYYSSHLWAATLPDVLRCVVEATGCGFLLDLSHARLAAHDLGMDPRGYLNALPVAHIREVHVTGIQTFTGHWLEKARRAGIDPDKLRFVERPIDHLPMLGEDWEMLEWALRQIRSGAWAEPWVIAYECGGVGWIYEAVMDEATLAEEVPRLYHLIHSGELP